MLLSLDTMLSCNDILLSPDKVQCSWLPGTAVWKRLPSCDKVTRTVIYKMFAEQYRKADDGTLWVLLNCLGKKYSGHICRMVAWIFLFDFSIVGTHCSWKYHWQHCSWQRIFMHEPNLRRVWLSEWISSQALQSVLCWGGRLLWGSCLTTLPLSEALPHLTDSLTSTGNRCWLYK